MSADHHRPANLTDAWRLLGALCVVWYHNPLYWNLPQAHLAVVDAIKLILLGWSMPFFYATSAKFAFAKKTPSRLARRIVTLLILIVFYTVLYELVRWRSSVGLIAHCIDGVAGNCSPTFVFGIFRNVGNTPGYYLSDLLSMYLLACLASIHPALRWIIMGFVWVALLMNQSRFGGLFLNPLALGCLGIALFYRPWIGNRLRNIERWPLSGFFVLSLLILLPITWGVMNYFLAQNDYWRDVSNILIFGAFLFGFLIIDDVIEPTGRVLNTLSHWGRQYSFGIFIFHQLCFDFLGAHIAMWTQRAFHIHDELILYFIVGVIATLASIISTIIARKISPILLAS